MRRLRSGGVSYGGRTQNTRPPAHAISAAFVYTKHNQAVAVTDSLHARVPHAGDISTGTDSFLTEDSRYLVVRSSAGDVSVIDVATGAVIGIDCACELTAPKPGAGSRIYWPTPDAALTELTTGTAEVKPKVLLNLVFPAPLGR